MSDIVKNLITDRTRADVDRWLYLSGKAWGNMTQAEQDEWGDNMRGAYNTRNMSRVSSAAHNLALRLEEMGYETGIDPAGIETIWFSGDVPTADRCAAYLGSVAALRPILPLPAETPILPTTMNKLTHLGANAIEANLVAVDRTLDLIQGTVELGWAMRMGYMGVYAAPHKEDTE